MNAALVSHKPCNRAMSPQEDRRNSACLATILLEFPVAVVERAHLARLEPARDAVEVEGVLVQSQYIA